MELKLVVLSLACFFVLMPTALGSLAIAKAAAYNAIKGASLIGEGLALKGKAALLGAQGLVQLAHKGAVMKGLLANAVAQNMNAGATMMPPPVFYPAYPLNTMVIPRPGPNLFDILSGVWRAVRNKAARAGLALGNMNCPPVVPYISGPNIYPMPVRCFNQFKRK